MARIWSQLVRTLLSMCEGKLTQRKKMDKRKWTTFLSLGHKKPLINEEQVSGHISESRLQEVWKWEPSSACFNINTNPTQNITRKKFRKKNMTCHVITIWTRGSHQVFIFQKNSWEKMVNFFVALFDSYLSPKFVVTCARLNLFHYFDNFIFSSSVGNLIFKCN